MRWVCKCSNLIPVHLTKCDTCDHDKPKDAEVVDPPMEDGDIVISDTNGTPVVRFWFSLCKWNMLSDLKLCGDDVLANMHFCDGRDAECVSVEGDGNCFTR